MAKPSVADVRNEILLAAEKIARRLQDLPGDADLVSAAAEFFSADLVVDVLDGFEDDEEDEA